MRLNVGKLSHASQYFQTLSSYENNKNNINISVPSLLPRSVKNHNFETYMLQVFLRNLEKFKDVEDAWERLGDILLTKMSVPFIIHFSSYFLVDSILDDLLQIGIHRPFFIELVQHFIRILPQDHPELTKALKFLKYRYRFFTSRNHSQILEFKKSIKEHPRWPIWPPRHTPKSYSRVFENKDAITETCELRTYSYYITPHQYNTYFVRTFCCLQTIHRVCCITYVYQQRNCPLCSKSYISSTNPIHSNRHRQTLIKKAEIENSKYIPFNIDTFTFIQNHPFILGSEI